MIYFKLSKFKSHQILIIIGGVIIFCSWIVEKNIKQNWTEAKERHLLNTINSNFRQVQRLNAETVYYTAIRKSEIDSGQIAFYQSAIVDIYLGLLQSYYTEKQMKSTDYDKFRKNQSRIMYDIRKYMNNREYYKVNKLFNEISNIFSKNYDSMNRAHSANLNHITRIEGTWNTIFIWLYSLGSILLGIGYLQRIRFNN